MKRSMKTKSILETLLVIGLILIIPLFFAINSGANEPKTPAEVSPIPPTAAVNAPEDSNTVKPKQPPACTFPLAQITTEEATPEEYIFFEPEVVLTGTEGYYHLNVAQWLPNNQQVLVTEESPNQQESNAPNDTSISLYNLETGESKLYATGFGIGETTMWLPELNGVVYSSVTISNIDTKNGTFDRHRKLWVSYGDPSTVQLLADNLQQPFIAKPDGSGFMYLSNKQIAKLDKTLKKLSASPAFDPAQWDYAKERRNKIPVRYHMAWQPGTPLIFLYSMAGVVGTEGGYTFILDTATGQICELNLGGWASRAQWSPDGRYLAIVRANSYTGISNAIDLVILDSTTGNLRTVGANLPDVEGKHYVSDFTWTPDSLHLLAFTNIPSHDGYYDLYLIDLTTDQSTNLFPEFKSFGGGGNNFVWSPDGSKLLARCPLSSALRVTTRYCLISVQSIKQ